MNSYLIKFRAEYYCQGLEWSWFERLVQADSYEEACDKIKNLYTRDWEKGTPELFKNLTL